MAIPKEPRQLMINIMYLVLTALLALNVSAEVFNAFKMVDKGLIKSNQALDAGNDALPGAIRDGAKKKASLDKYANLIEPGRELSSQLNDEIQKVIDIMVKTPEEMEGGMGKGYVPDEVNGGFTDELKAKKDYDITTRLLVDGPNGDGNGMGEELKAKLLKYRADMLALIEDDPETEANEKDEFAKSIAVEVDDQTWQDKDKASWSHMNFDHMPLQAVLPIFSKFQNDVKSTESAFLNYLAGKVGLTKEVVIENFKLVHAPKSTYVIKGEKFETEVFLSAEAGTDSKTSVSFKVGGQSLSPNKDGVVNFTQSASSLGKKTIPASATMTNPVTGESDTYTTEIVYEVGERSVSVAATKMNVFYIGVKNPVAVTAAGVPSNQIKVSMAGSGGGTITKDAGNYAVKVTKPTRKGEFAKINVSAPGLNESRDFRVKRIPDPVPKLSKSRGGGMPSGEFKLQPGVFPVLENFDFDAKCEIAGFRLVRVPKRQDPQVAENRGGKFGSDAAKLMKQAKPSDKYFFEGIKCRCPGDPAPRDLGGMVFNIR